jgi:Ca-activated chloride channel family protein
MRFADPYLLAVGLVVVAALAWAALVSTRRRAAALAAAGAGPGRRRRGLAAGLWLTLAGLAVLAVGAGGPSVTVPESHASGTVILAVDVSGSMTATDVSPSRLGAAKSAARGFINAQPGSVDIGVVAFEQGGLETAAPTADHTKALTAVGQLKAAGGTSLGAAILAALSAITHKTVSPGANGTVPSIGYWPSATVVLLSDGGTSSASASGSDSSGDSGVSTAAAAAVAQKAGVHIDTVGVGTAAGATIDVDGYHLFTALDAGSLKSISSATGGSYHPASDASELNGIASTINLRLTVSRQPLPLAGALILLALVLLAAGAVLTVTRTGRVI